jgi:dTDP-4-amino-4,6-dideoxygalactose transaminase
MLTARHIEQITSIAKEIAPDGGLHNPNLGLKEREYLTACIDMNEVSSIGAFVLQFGRMLEKFTGAKHAIPVVNGTAALTLALKIAGVKPGDNVITQPLTFVGTCNAIAACGAVPVFVDVEASTGGMSAESLKERLGNINTGRVWHGDLPSAIVPVDVMGIPYDVKSMISIIGMSRIPIIEDAAEALGSYFGGPHYTAHYMDREESKQYTMHCGKGGHAGILSFNGNKTITTGGGGAILTDSDEWADRARHLSTQAKLPHRWEFEHDQVANNLRMPNVNAALGCGQMERIDEILKSKEQNFEEYQRIFDAAGCDYMRPVRGDCWNHWLVTLLAEDVDDRDRLLVEFNERGVKARPLWKPLNRFGPYKGCASMPTPNADWLYERAVCLPSGVRSCEE